MNLQILSDEASKLAKLVDYPPILLATTHQNLQSTSYSGLQKPNINFFVEVRLELEDVADWYEAILLQACGDDAIVKLMKNNYKEDMFVYVDSCYTEHSVFRVRLHQVRPFVPRKKWTLRQNDVCEFKRANGWWMATILHCNKKTFLIYDERHNISIANVRRAVIVYI